MPELSRLSATIAVLVVVLAGCTGGISTDATTTGAPVETAGPTTAGEGTLEVHFVNVGQSVSTLVVGPTGETMLVDTGHYTDDGEHVATLADTTTGGTTATTDGGTNLGDAQLVVATVHADADGDDRENLNDEYVVFANDGSDALDLTGWTVEDEVGKTYTVPDGFTLAAGDSVTLHTGTGADSDTDLYWGAGSPVWNNDGDTVTVHNSDGTVVLTETYG